ncbi:DUF4332 domain-containing protein [Neptuniibacter sp. CAU 1671]|uniref:DUF4332 domain-containing protein n=1 Tax=Neptuniibacter sp. CAU 1671 TaxID=3032593 RepID=UPI0023DC1681|nr:DUF4332 domain-containing protein [Neptuniibacter sp. CAU 1671]MDF2182264.1 DUF4332 domain-containing protein [Neptuniibacter sp. CAU 1671]
MTKLAEIEGIGETYAGKLEAIGINTQEQLLSEGSTPSGRKKITDESGLSDKLVLKWINRADLARVKGIGSEYADLLEVAGVDTVPELAQRNAKNLYEKLVAVNDDKNLVRKLPSETQVENWIAEAKDLPRAINY